MLGDVAGVVAQQVVDDLHLPVAVRPRADADGGNGQSLRDGARHLVGHQLQDDAERAGLLQGKGVLQHGLRLRLAFALHPVPAELVHRLRGEPDVAHDRNARLRDAMHRLGDPNAALQLHRLRAGFLQEASSILQRLLNAEVVGEERHVGGDQRALGAAHHRRRVVQHHLHRHRDGGAVAQHHLPQAVADEDDRHARLLHQLGGGVVVGRQHGEPLPSRLETLHLERRYTHGAPSC